MLCRKIQIISLPPIDLTTPLSEALLKIIFRKSVAAHRTSGRLSAAEVPLRQFSEEWMEELFIFFCHDVVFDNVTMLHYQCHKQCFHYTRIIRDFLKRKSNPWMKINVKGN